MSVTQSFVRSFVHVWNVLCMFNSFGKRTWMRFGAVDELFKTFARWSIPSCSNTNTISNGSETRSSYNIEYYIHTLTAQSRRSSGRRWDVAVLFVHQKPKQCHSIFYRLAKRSVWLSVFSVAVWRCHRRYTELNWQNEQRRRRFDAFVLALLLYSVLSFVFFTGDAIKIISI